MNSEPQAARQRLDSILVDQHLVLNATAALAAFTIPVYIQSVVLNSGVAATLTLAEGLALGQKLRIDWNLSGAGSVTVVTASGTTVLTSSTSSHKMLEYDGSGWAGADSSVDLEDRLAVVEADTLNGVFSVRLVCEDVTAGDIISIAQNLVATTVTAVGISHALCVADLTTKINALENFSAEQDTDYITITSPGFFVFAKLSDTISIDSIISDTTGSVIGGVAQYCIGPLKSLLDSVGDVEDSADPAGTLYARVADKDSRLTVLETGIEDGYQVELVTNPANGEYLSLWDQQFTFVSALTEPAVGGEVLLGANKEATTTNLFAAFADNTVIFNLVEQDHLSIATPGVTAIIGFSTKHGVVFSGSTNVPDKVVFSPLTTQTKNLMYWLHTNFDQIPGTLTQHFEATFTNDIVATDAVTIGFPVPNEVTGEIDITGMKTCECVASGATYLAGDFTFDLGAGTGGGVGANTAANFVRMVNVNNFSPFTPQGTAPIFVATANAATVSLRTNKLAWVKMDKDGVIEGADAHVTVNFFPDDVYGSGNLTQRSIATFLNRLNHELRFAEL